MHNQISNLLILGAGPAQTQITVSIVVTNSKLTLNNQTAHFDSPMTRQMRNNCDVQGSVHVL